MKLFRSLNTGFFVMNVPVFIVIALSHHIHGLAVIYPGWYDWLRYIVFLAVFVIFAFFENNYWVPTAVSLTLFDIDPLFGIVTAADLILTLIHSGIIRRLKPLPGYPRFIDIRIIYERVNTPKTDI